ncbi:MAG: O-methyltransferase [Mycobacteriales bacterium]
MDTLLTRLLDELYQDGLRYDAAQPDRRQRRRNLEPDAAALLWLLLHSTAARTVVEIGTSNGYSTIWFADAVRDAGGRLVSVDIDAEVQREAAANLRRAGVESVVELWRGDGGDYLRSLPDGSVDLLFLDSERPDYPGWWETIHRVLRPGGTLVVDNATSHAAEVAPFRRLVEAEPGYVCTLVEVGKGEFLAVKPLDDGPDGTAGQAAAGVPDA